MKLQLASIFGLLALVEASVLQRRQGQCHHDLCYRAIDPTTRPGAADCSSFFPAISPPPATVTPPTVTVTITATATESFTQTDSQTLTDTLHDTLTITSPTTVTGTTVEVTETITRPLVTDPVLPPLQKRQAASITWSDSISSGAAPAYASPCSGWVRYSSACSCLLKSTVTASAPTSTVTVTEATVSVTETISPTLATVEITVTDFSTTTYEPVTTVTATSTVATDIWLSLYIVGREDDLNKANQYLKVDSQLPGFEGVSPLGWTATSEEATKFNLNSATGHLKVESTQEFVCAQFVPKDAIFAYVMSTEKSQYYNAPKLEFDFDDDNNVLLQSGDYVKLGWTANAGENLVIAKSGVNWGRFKAKEVFLEVISAED